MSGIVSLYADVAALIDIGLIGAGVSTPFVVVLLLDLYDDFIKLAEASTAKAVLDQVTAFKDLGDTQVADIERKVLAWRVRADRVRLTCIDWKHDRHLAVISQPQHLWFSTSPDGKRLQDAI